MVWRRDMRGKTGDRVRSSTHNRPVRIRLARASGAHVRRNIELTLFRGERKPDQLGYVAHFELGHQVGFVHLDSARADVE